MVSLSSLPLENLDTKIHVLCNQACDSFYDLMSKTDTTVIKFDYTVNKVVSTFLNCEPGKYNSVVKSEAWKP